MGSALLSGQAFAGNIFADQRKTAAYNALRAVYGDVAGDPDAAAKLQETDQKQQLFPGALEAQGLENKQTQAQTGLATAQTGLATANTDEQNQKNARAAALRAALSLQGVASNGGDVGAEFDRIVGPNAASFGINTPEELAKWRQTITTDPRALPAIIKGLQNTSGDPNEQRFQLITQKDGSVVRVPVNGPDGTAQPVPGVTAYQPEIAQQRLQQGADRLDPSRVGERAQAAGQGTAVGRAAGEAEAGLPAMEAFQGLFNKRAEEILGPSDPSMPGYGARDETFKSIFGAPSLKGFFQHGGLGAAGELWGSDAADAASDLKTLTGDVQRMAYESLRGGGAITEAERTSIASAYANLERSQSFENYKANIARYQDVVKTVISSQRQRAGLAAPQGGDAPANGAIDYLDYFGGKK